MGYQDLTARERISRVHIDLMQDLEFSRIGPTTQIGETRVTGPECPTAKTDGLDRWYNEAWVMRMTREQLRYVVAHECFHMLLMHCTLYTAPARKYRELFGMAIDFVVNLLVEELDGGRGFVARPTDIPPLIDIKYKDMSCLEVLEDLLRNPPPSGGSTLDEHEQREIDEILQKAEEQMLDDARHQGELASSRLRGTAAGAESLKGFERTSTEWRRPLQQFLQEHMEGDSQSRWNPLNKLFAPLGIKLPSHFDEAASDLLIGCDTSASMRPYYARIFGEIGRVAEQVQPRSITVLWWDTKVAGVQKFGPSEYSALDKKLQAKGGGGTHVSCVADYMVQNKLKPQATIILTDGYIESQYRCPPGPLLWGVVGNARFTPLRGKLLRIGKETL